MRRVPTNLLTVLTALGLAVIASGALGAARSSEGAAATQFRVSAVVAPGGAEYSVNGYVSGPWHPATTVRKAGVRDARYGGYDCRPVFRYGYAEGVRARFEAVMCDDGRGSSFVARGTTVRAPFEG